MKKFIVSLSQKQKSLMPEELIMNHVTYLKSLKEKGVLPFCGPCTDGTALMIIDAPSFEIAKEYVEDDPFSKINYYKDRKIVEIEEATEDNEFLLQDVLSELHKLG
ncbi:YciI family protein [Evansella halocellulosilytica]|uniref:YciI family protein n=1 Tax=Evansella halocellulosilytica TaxID=2011013 RepID=UPI000BB8B84F|nr:YciI family protein [Evansella halocellulosilytica]